MHRLTAGLVIAVLGLAAAVSVSLSTPVPEEIARPDGVCRPAFTRCVQLAQGRPAWCNDCYGRCGRRNAACIKDCYARHRGSARAGNRCVSDHCYPEHRQCYRQCQERCG
jgi:hypothetical protein